MDQLSPLTCGYTDEYTAGEALRNAIKDGLWRVGPQIQLLVAEFILPPWFARFFDRDAYQPLWMQGIRSDCCVCGRKNAAVRDSSGRLVREAFRESFYPGNREVGGACSERCTWWDAA